jgi:hypothetical protein
VLRRMSWCPERFQLEVADEYDVAVVEYPVRKFGLTKPSCIDRRPSRFREFARSAHEVGMHVCLENGDDPELVFSQPIEILLDVAPRIDDRGDSPLGIGDTVRHLCQARRIESLDDYCRSRFPAIFSGSVDFSC